MEQNTLKQAFPMNDENSSINNAQPHTQIRVNLCKSVANVKLLKGEKI